MIWDIAGGIVLAYLAIRILDKIFTAIARYNARVTAERAAYEAAYEAEHPGRRARQRKVFGLVAIITIIAFILIMLIKQRFWPDQ